MGPGMKNGDRGKNTQLRAGSGELTAIPDFAGGAPPLGIAATGDAVSNEVSAASALSRTIPSTPRLNQQIPEV
jgi:hypothetical protein